MLDLFDELRSVIARLDQDRIPHALCGGLAMAVHGSPRATVDIDVLVLTKDLDRVEAAVAPIGSRSTRTPHDLPRGAVEIRRLSKVHESGQCCRSTFSW